MTPADARAELLAIPLCGPRVVERLESIGVTCLRDLRHEDPYDLMVRVNLAAGRPIWRSIRAVGCFVPCSSESLGPGPWRKASMAPRLMES